MSSTSVLSSPGLAPRLRPATRPDSWFQSSISVPERAASLHSPSTNSLHPPRVCCRESTQVVCWYGRTRRGWARGAGDTGFRRSNWHIGAGAWGSVSTLDKDPRPLHNAFRYGTLRLGPRASLCRCLDEEGPDATLPAGPHLDHQQRLLQPPVRPLPGRGDRAVGGAPATSTGSARAKVAFACLTRGTEPWPSTPVPGPTTRPP